MLPVSLEMDHENLTHSFSDKRCVEIFSVVGLKILGHQIICVNKVAF